MCNFDKIYHLIKVDLKKEESLKKHIKILPPILSKDTSFKVVTISKEQHIANKIYVILKSLEFNSTKQIRRYKDFYDLYYLIRNDDFNKNEVNKCLDENFKRFGNFKDITSLLETLDENFINKNQEFYLKDKEKHEFKNLSFEDLIKASKIEIQQTIK